MADRGHRELERQAVQGDLEARAAQLIRRARTEPGFKRSIVYAACLGDPAARLIHTEKPAAHNYSNYTWKAWDASAANHRIHDLMWQARLIRPIVPLTTGWDIPFLTRCAVAAARSLHSGMCAWYPSRCQTWGCPMATAIKSVDGWLDGGAQPSASIGVSENDWSEAWWDRLGALASGRVAQFRWALESALRAANTEESIFEAVRDEVVPYLYGR